MIDSNINSLGEDRNFKIKIKHRTDGKGEMPKIKILDKPLGSNGEQRERIIEQDFNGENIRFHKQLNSYDCGPCLVLNALEVLKGGDESLKTIEDVRQKINSIVVDKHGPSSWVTDIDISLLFSRIEGIKPINTNFTGIVLSNELFQNTIDNSIQSKQKLFIFSGSRNSHFVGHFLDENVNVWRLNSFEDGPVQISIDEFRNYWNELRQENSNANVYAFHT